MTFRAILYAYILGGFTLVPLILCALVAYAIYTSEPVSPDAKERTPTADEQDLENESLDVQDIPKTRKGWLTVRRTFEESAFDGGYVTLVRSFLDARSKDPKRSRPRDMWYVVLKGKILYLYEDEAMTECEAAIQLGSHNVVIFPEGLLDGELFTKRNAICLKPKKDVKAMPSVSRDMQLDDDKEGETTEHSAMSTQARSAARKEALSNETPWFIFVRSTVEMEDWFYALIHGSQQPAQTPTLNTLQEVFLPSDMNILVSTLDEQPDIIPMRWFNALFGRIFYGFYKTQHLESFIIGRLMKKLSKVKRPTFLNDIVVTEVSVGNRTPVFSKPMLKELTKEGDASMEVHLSFKGEVRITVQATATINLGARFKPYTVKLVLAAVLRELEGNLLVKIKRPPSNRLWYAFTQMPRMVLNVEPVVSDRQITWSMILSTIETSLKTIIQESVVMPNMDDIAFFETVHREGNRGGIWGTAARKQGVFNMETESPSNPPPTLEESLLSYSENDSANPTPMPLHKPLSLQESSSSTPEPPLMASSSTLPETSSSTVGSSNRRKTWFNSARGTDANALSDQYPENDMETESRGRTLDAQKPPIIRSQSTPKAEGSNEDDDNASISSSLGSSSAKQRSTSQSSSIRESGTSSTSSASDSARARNNNDGSSLSVPASTGTPPSPTNFLTTLKTRAGDKQALSNSAKEAMRKWGVKWAGLNKDSSGVDSSSQNEDMPDHDSVGDGAGFHIRARTVSHMDGSSSSSQRNRASYAEVRAAVAERRVRSDHRQEPSERTRTEGVASTPIPIPPNNNSNSQNEISSLPVDGIVASSIGASAPLASSSYPTNERDFDVQSHSVSLSASGSSSASSTKSSPADGMARAAHSTSALPLDETAPVHSPIHVQPQPKTMSIPGIHASHRGEIMSMGYVAPSPQGENEKETQRNRASSQGSTSLGLGSLGTSSLSKNPKIQSMYRLWKQASSNSNSNLSEGQDSPSQSEESSRNEVTPSTSSQSSTAPQQNLNPTQSTPVLPGSMSKRAPPLPPRPSPVTISPSRPPPLPARAPSSVSRANASNMSIQHHSPPPSIQSLFPSQTSMIPSAQDTLKEIATKDDHTRKRASLSLSAGNSVSESPPSPAIGRRTSTAGSARSSSPIPALSLTPDDPATARPEDHRPFSLESDVDPTHAWGLDDEDFVSEGPETNDHGL